MDRINVYDQETGGLAGWFDLDTTTVHVEEAHEWNGHNHVGVISGLQCGHTELYRTKGGRWVEHRDARREFDGPETWKFLTDKQAQKWLLRAGTDHAEEVLGEYFSETPEESGPGGRPEVGPTISTALTQAQLDAVDRAAAEANTSRAQTIRNLLDQALAAHTA